MNRTITVFNDEVLVACILEARKKIVYVAPGVSKAVADTLGKRLPDMGMLSITLIVDVDAEVYRMGYGEIEGLQDIKRLADEHFLELRQQSGVRIGLLKADDRTLVYAPTPRLIEAGSRAEEKPNAIMLGEDLPELERACGADIAEKIQASAEATITSLADTLLPLVEKNHQRDI